MSTSVIMVIIFGISELVLIVSVFASGIASKASAVGTV